MSDTSLATSQLFKAIHGCNWQTVIKQIQSDPSLAKTKPDGLLPLHAACNAPLRAPLKLIKMLLTAHSEAAKIKCGKDDRLPIHILLATAPSPFIPYTPPSEDVVSALIDLYPGAARVPDAGNQLPIHLACQITGISEAALTFILSTYPEGAYARDFHGRYPLDYATANKDIPTRKLALAALDRGTLYASISKMTSLRLSKENDSKTRSMEETYEKKLSKMESHAKEERAKLIEKLDGMKQQLKEEQERNKALVQEKEKILVEKDQAVARAIQFERARYAKLEDQLRSELADVQLKNMDLLDQLMMTQGALDASKETEEKQAEEIGVLKQNLSESNNKVEDSKAELKMVQDELNAVKTELDTTLNVVDQKSARISHLEQSLENTKSSVLHLIQEHERMQANMEKQKESLGIFISQQMNAEKDARTSLLNMSLLVDAIDVSQCDATTQGTVDEAFAEEEVPGKIVKGDSAESLGLAEEGQ